MIRWGILGAGNIARRFAESLAKEDNGTLVAISGRNEQKMLAFQKEHPCEKYYVSHEDLLNDPTLDAIYIALPHHLHKEWILKALIAKKAVLVEKPACMNAQEAKEITECAKKHHVLFMEAMKARFEAASQYIRTQIQNGTIGELQSLEIHYGFDLPKANYDKTYHTQQDCGGVLYDIGIYGISYLEEYLDGDPICLYTDADFYKGIEIHLDTELEFTNGRARLLLGFDFNEEPTVVFNGTSGTMLVHHLHRPDIVDIYRPGKPEIHKTFPYETDDFSMEIEHFQQLLEEGKIESDIHSLSSMIREFEIMDIIRESFTDYTEEDLFPLSEQEQYLRFERFHNEDARALGNKIADLTSGFRDGVSISITRLSDHLEVYHYASDARTKKDATQLALLEKQVEETGHSTAYLWAKERMEKKNSEYTSGGFPIYLSTGQLVGVVCITGLKQGKNHTMIIEALEKILDMRLPKFKKALR